MNDLDRIFVALERLAEGTVLLAGTDKDITTVLKQMNGMLGEIDKRLTALETERPADTYEVFLTTKSGNYFPVKALASQQEAYYWIMDRITLNPLHWEMLRRFNDLSFGYDRRFRDFDVTRIEIKKT